MSITTLLLMILINLVFQSSILPFINLFGITPNTGLVLIVIVALRQGKYYGGFFGLSLGLVQDILFGQAIGVNALIYFIFGYGVGLIQDSLDIENIIIPVFVSAFGTIFYNFSYYIIIFFLSRNVPIEVMINNVISMEILYNAIIAALLYKLFSKIFVIPSLRFGKR